MGRTIGYLHDDERLSEAVTFIAILAMSIGLALPLWGLAVILFDFTLVFLPVFVVVGLVLGAIKAVHVLRERKARHG